MKYYKGKYIDGSTAIWCETDNGEPYATVSICLVDYDQIPPDENHIFMPLYKFTSETKERFYKDLVEREICPVQIGYGVGSLVKLRDDWKAMFVSGSIE